VLKLPLVGEALKGYLVRAGKSAFQRATGSEGLQGGPVSDGDVRAVTCISAFWEVGSKHTGKYDQWFKNTLRINAPYVFYGLPDTLDKVYRIRSGLLTHGVVLKQGDFDPVVLKADFGTDATHVPSKELGRIWLQKVFLVADALQKNPFSSEWFVFIDAGISSYRDTRPPDAPWPNMAKIGAWRKDAFNFTSSSKPDKERRARLMKEWGYEHEVTGGNFAMHASFVPVFVALYRRYLDDAQKQTKVFTGWSEQAIFTRMRIENPGVFNEVGEGYGSLVPLFY
jgi:hypothetical protein